MFYTDEQLSMILSAQDYIFVAFNSEDWERFNAEHVQETMEWLFRVSPAALDMPECNDATIGLLRTMETEGLA